MATPKPDAAVTKAAEKVAQTKAKVTGTKPVKTKTKTKTPDTSKPATGAARVKVRDELIAQIKKLKPALKESSLQNTAIPDLRKLFPFPFNFIPVPPNL